MRNVTRLKLMLCDADNAEDNAEDRWRLKRIFMMLKVMCIIWTVSIAIAMGVNDTNVAYGCGC